MDRRGRGDKKVFEIARTETFGGGNLGSPCFYNRAADFGAGFDGDRAPFIRGDLSGAALRYAGSW